MSAEREVRNAEFYAQHSALRIPHSALVMLYSANEQSIQLGRQIGAGGAGAVYEISGQPELVAKRFHSALSAEHLAKLQAMVALNDERLNQLTAWPIALLYDKPDGSVVGFLMNRVAQASELHSLHSPKSRLQKFPEATWEFLLYVAANVARAVATVHAHGFIIGDINPKNILVTRQATVHLLDCDSFQVRTADGQTLRCEQGFPEYTPPELQGVTFRDIDRTVEHDAFGLAVVIFQLLFLGRHPFSGRYLGEGEMPIERAIQEQRFAYGDTANSREMQPPPGVLPWVALPDDLAQLFERTFLTNERAKPEEWLVALEKLAQSLKTCQTESLHLYSDHLAQCPWCELEARAGLRLFGLVKIDLPEHVFILDDIWREIDQVEAPWLALAPRPAAIEIVPTKDAQNVGTASMWDSPLTCLLLAAICFGAGLLSSYIFLLVLIPYLPHLFTLLAQYESRLKAQLGVSRFSLEKANTTSLNPFKAELAEAQAAMKLLDDRLEAVASREVFFAKKDELKARYEEYGKLNQARLERLRELEKETYRLQPATAAGAAPRLLPRSRWQVEQEIKTRRFELEEVLQQGVTTLQKVKQDIESNRHAMHDELFAAQTRLAQAEANYEASTNLKSSNPILVMLLISFFLGTGYNFLSPPAAVDRTPVPIRTEEGTAPPVGVKPPHEPTYEAAQAYSDALYHLDGGRFTDAADKLRKATRLDPQFDAAFERLAYVFYQTRQFEEAVDAAKKAIYLRPGFRPYALLGNVYYAQEKWDGARVAFAQAFSQTPQPDWDEDYLIAHEQYVKALVKLKQHEQRIQEVEGMIARSEVGLAERLHLGLLYLQINKLSEAETQRKILVRDGATTAANLLFERMKVAGTKMISKDQASHPKH